MSIVFKLTNAGRAALVNPPNTGTDPRTVVSLGVSATHTVIAPTLLTLPGEIKRIAQVAGGVVAADMIHVNARDSGGDSYTVRALGLYLDDGTLLGAYSQAAPIVEKSGESILLMSTDIQFQDGSLDLSNLIFGDTNFDNPPATTDRQGVVELATEAETSTGSDSTRAVTPAGLKPLLDAKVNKATSMTAGAGLTGGGDLSGNRTVAMGVPSNITSSSGNTVAAETHTHALDATGVVAGAYGGSSAIPTFTVDAKGRMTQAGSVALTWGNIGGKPTTLDGFGITDAAPLESPALTGNPTAPNPATGTRSMAIATMQKFADEFSASLAANGYQKLPSGLIIQWGAVANATNGQYVAFPITFPNVLWSVVIAGSTAQAAATSNGLKSGFNIAVVSGNSVNWIAVGG